MAEETANNVAAGADTAKGGRKKLLIMAAAAIALLGIGVGVGLLFGGRSAPPEEEAASEVATRPAPAIYVSLGDAFMVTLQYEGRQRYCKTSLSAMTRDEAIVEELEVHAPLIRGRLNSLLGEQDFGTLRTDDGRRALRERILATVQEVLRQETGQPGVERVYFTDLVLQ